MGRLVPYGTIRYTTSQPYLMILALKSSGLMHKYAQNRHQIRVAVLIGRQRDLNGISTAFNGMRTAPRRLRDGSSTSFATHRGRLTSLDACSPWRTTERARWPPYAPFCSDYVSTPLFPAHARPRGRALYRAASNRLMWRR